MPDFLRLTAARDKDAFRRWFAFLAEYEASLGNERLPAEIDDCAALLRFAYREALRTHDAPWASEMKLTQAPAIDDVEKYEYPRTPVGAKVFRVREGSFHWTDLQDGAFAEFADAKTLLTLNTYLVRRDLSAARPGDILFFRQPDQQSPFHSMIFVGRGIENGPREWLVYHTGPEGKSKGEMRRVTVDELKKHPDGRWHPVRENPHFLGIYRWNILREGN